MYKPLLKNQTQLKLNLQTQTNITQRDSITQPPSQQQQHCLLPLRFNQLRNLAHIQNLIRNLIVLSYQLVSIHLVTPKSNKAGKLQSMPREVFEAPYLSKVVNAYSCGNYNPKAPEFQSLIRIKLALRALNKGYQSKHIRCKNVHSSFVFLMALGIFSWQRRCLVYMALDKTALLKIGVNNYIIKRLKMRFLWSSNKINFIIVTQG